jgi:hypothetical protein
MKNKIYIFFATIALLFVFNLVPIQKIMAQPCGSFVGASASPSSVMPFSGWLSTDTKFGVDAYVKCEDPYLVIYAKISDGINSPTSLYYTDAVNPSVALFDSSTTVFAVVAYITASTGIYYYDIFTHNLGGYSLYSGGNLLEVPSSAPFIPGIRINADKNGYGVIVWTDWDGSTGGLNVATIWTNGNTISPTIVTSPTPITLLSGRYDCDVAINYPDIFYADGYTSLSAFVEVSQAGWNTPTSTSSPWSFSPSGDIRIACNNANNSTSHDWTAVYNYGNQIWGQTSIGGVLQTAQEYTLMVCSSNVDLSTSPQSNFMPVVSYSPDYVSPTSGGGILVGWNYSTINNTPISIPDSLSVIALNCDHHGVPINDYWMVVPPISGTPPFPNVQCFLELTGRDQPMGGSILYAWDDYSSSGDIVSKRVPWSASSLRTEYIEKENKILTGIFPNPSNGNFMINTITAIGELVNIEIYNAMGQKVYSSREEASSTTYSKEVSLKNYEAGIYFVREVGTTANNNWKIVLTN